MFVMFFSAISQFEYRLVVTSMSPDKVSLYGDTLITIRGHGFGTVPTEVRVQFGGMGCYLVSLTDEQIECMIDPPTRVTLVDNSGVHPRKY